MSQTGQPAYDGVVGVNNSPLFDDVMHTQGGMPHLMQFLWDEYVNHLKAQIESRKANKQPTVEIDEAIKRAPASAFAKWAADYLRENRMMQHFFVDENHGILLSNNRSVVLSPGIDIRGTMQDAGAVGVTQGRSNPGNNGVTSDTTLRI